MRYHISNSDECLAITGMGIRSVRITKADWVWPFQRCTRFSVQPHDYAMDLQVMTVEKLQFSLPVVFIVGPDVNRRGANGPGVNGPGAGFKIGGGPGDPETSAPTEDSEDRGYAVVKYAMLLATAGRLRPCERQGREPPDCARGQYRQGHHRGRDARPRDQYDHGRHLHRARRLEAPHLPQHPGRAGPVRPQGLQRKRQGAQGRPRVRLLRLALAQGPRGRHQPGPN